MVFILKRVCIVVSLLTLGACTNTQQTLASHNKEQQQPNIIFILVDDMGFGDTGFNGSEIATPNLDQMANAGVRLDRNYVYPICSPTRAALLTGQNPLRHGVDGPMSDESSLPTDLRIMPEYFADLGYQTFMVGKWHLGIGNTDHWPISRGFDYHYGFLGGWIDFYSHIYAGGLDWSRNGETISEEGHATDLLSVDAANVIKNRVKDSPFFLYLAYNAPHSPLQNTPTISGLNDVTEVNDRSVYSEMVTQMDAGVGQVVAALESEGILDNTIIVFSSDNGGSLTLGANNANLSGGKGSSLEGGLRVPGLVWAPGKISGGGDFTQPITILDWLPTLLEAAGGNPDSVADADGQNMWPALTKNQELDRKPFLLGARENRAVFDWPWKLVVLGGNNRNPEGSTQLFNIIDDPEEKNDLTEQQPEIFAQLSATLAAMPAVESRRDTLGRGANAYFLRDDNDQLDYEQITEATSKPWTDIAVKGEKSF